MVQSKSFITFCLLFLSVTFCKAAQVDTVQVFSTAMQKNIRSVVITPNNYTSTLKYPVVYLLHGYSGSYKAGWLRNKPTVQHWANDCQMILVIADGGFSSWYFDSPIDPAYQYETYISKELVSFIDKSYSTIASPKGRAITGLSMGGHGAFYLSFKHQDVYGAAGSTSGGVDLRPFPQNWDIAKRLGAYAEYPENWEKNSVINMTHLLTSKSLALIFDCGTEDFFYKVNSLLHEKLLLRNIPHEFISRPGNHNSAYWDNSIDSHFLFFHKFFKNAEN